MSKPRPPWEVDPQLMRERLSLIATTIQRKRAQVVVILDIRPNDKTWGPGCLAHEWVLGDLALLQADHEWLWVHVRGQECWLAIGGVRVTFYRGGGDRPPARAVRRAIRAARSARGGTLDLFVDLEDPVRGNDLDDDDGQVWRWYLAIVPADDGVSVLEVIMLQASDSGAVRNKWSIDIDAPIAVVAGVSEIQPAPKDLGPPQIYDLPEKEAGQTEESKRAEGGGQGKVIPFKRGAEDDEGQ